MAKSSLEKAIEKQRKEAEKSARQAQLRERANAIVSGAEIVSGFRIMDREAENMLSAILEQYDGNENNHVNFVLDNLPRYLQDSFSLQCEKLQMYGMLLSAIVYMGGAMFTLSESGKKYLEDKEKAYNRLEEQTKKEEKVEMSNHKKYDVFISHASSDKSEYVDLLNIAIRRLEINVFYDTDVLSWGDNWKKVILDGTADSEFAIIVISKNFFGREWTERELEEFLKQQNESGQKKVLPLLYEITLDDLKEHYPDLEEIQCISAERYNKEEIVILLAKELIKRYK
ncbi:MAG: toll/interleukin-1 receptor domain-containing protein [Lachnospiraceae bacterium]|nr:toll/interleukin-1 receptor domain-containing protein [Lachnospiraceae bacterium]